ncbi:MAG: DUF5989 family protein [Chloroflexota bacterium]
MKKVFRMIGSNFKIVGSLFGFMTGRGLWFLIPMIVILMVFAVFIMLSTNPAIAPFIYTLF